MSVTSSARSHATLVRPGSFEPERHFYPRVLNATIHPMVSYFMRFSTQRIVSRYCHLNPRVDPLVLREILHYQPRYLRWAGADLFNVTTAEGVREMVLIETNSCPSGQKSMPLVSEHQEQGGYQVAMERTIGPAFTRVKKVPGGLAVLYDKNPMGNSGYAAAMADHLSEPVYLAPFYQSDPAPPARFSDRMLEVRDAEGVWHPIRAAFRYVTQKPWNRIPLDTRTLILNPVIGCLAGGRNKAVAAMAYELLNAELVGTGLEVIIPETIRDVGKAEIPLLVRRFGGHAVVKIPYSNAGQGVYTITNQHELDRFMEGDYSYDRFIVQSLIGNYLWSSQAARGRFYHVGTLPNKHNQIFVADLRMMISAGEDGFRPLAVYGRRARLPLEDRIPDGASSWDMLGTNLSVKTGEDQWESETNRLLLMDRKDFNLTGLGFDDLIKGFIQTVLAVVAVDKMACNLVNSKGRFRLKLFRSINTDETLLDEIAQANP